MIQNYLDAIIATHQRGDAREESYYETLANLLRRLAEFQNIKNFDVTTLPKKTEAGNPDFRIWDGKQRIIGYIEAKDPKVKNLDAIEESEQLQRYLSTFPNVILTNFLEFRLYRNGEMTHQVSIGRPLLLKKLGTAPLENADALGELIMQFFSFVIPKIYHAKSLAEELAKRTKFLRDEVLAIELDESRRESKEILGYYEGFKKYLVGALTRPQFADLYAQTITYGLFAARTRAGDGEDFSRRTAFDHVPNTIGILRDVFRFISLGDAPKQLKILVDDLVEVLKVTDVSKILDRFYEEGKGNDPIIHFYETFLAKYDPSVRERRGVYYTPEPVVHYITKSLHHLLKTKFNKPDGFASEGVTVLDPAGGTLTFPSEAIRLAVDEYTEKYGTGGRKSFIKNHILKNFYAFELMMAPYAIGHLKIGFILDELGYHMAEDERFPLYLTNTLEMEELDQISIPGLSSLSEESHLAGEVKKSQPILVVMGNPPYSIEAGTLTKEARELVQRYKFIDGEKIKEKGALQFEKNLQDDYVKFIAFAQQKIEKSDHGVVGIITNHSFLESPTLRGMRWQLMNSFDEIYVLDLHGSSKKKERTPDGGKDENVFDIQQGVSICFLIKNEESNNKAKVYKADLFGLREDKYDFLEGHTIANTKFKRIYPSEGFYFFKEYDHKLEKSFNKFPSLKDIFPDNGAGIITAHDGFAIEDDAKALSNRFNRFKAARSDEDELHDSFQVKKKKGWSIVKAWEAFQKLTGSDIEEKIIPITYRPFDQKYIMYEDHIVWSMSNPTMQHMRNENLGLMAPRQFKEESGALVTEYVMAHKTVSAYDTNFMFPLYLYSQKEEKKRRGDQVMLFMEPESEFVAKRPNISEETFDMLAKAYGKKPSPENIFYYIYAVLYSPTYREKYAEFLKIDFPRVPFAKDKVVFFKLGALGERLADLHLLKSSELDPPIARYMGEGDDNVIVKPEWTLTTPTSAHPALERRGAVRINTTKYFEGVPEEVWNYHIGGYQVLHKYLKDRKGRKMDDPRHYCRIVTSLARTIELQKEIDLLFEAVEKSVIDWKI